jgi:type IV secretion system protein VirB6
MDGWILLFGGYIDGITSTYVTAVVTQLSLMLAPLVFSGLTLWWILIGWAVLRGEIRETVSTIAWKVFKISMIITIALNVGVYNDFVAGTADGLRDGMANVFGVTIDGADTTQTQATVWTAINDFDQAGGALVTEVSKDASWYNIPVWVALFFVMTGQTLLVLASLFIAVLTKVFQSFFLAVGPVFILGLAFKPTQRFFDGWLGMIVNTIILSWIGLFLTGFGMYLMTAFAQAVTDGWNILMPVKTALQYCGMCLIFVVMLWQAPGWAAALAGGSSIQTGISMVTQALIVRGRSSGAGSTGSSGVPGANAVARGAGAYGAGAAAGRAVGAAGRWGRRAMYRMAAIRGRR